MDTHTRISIIDFLPRLLFEFLVFWFIDSIIVILKATYAAIIVVSDMFALPILFKTFFVPWRAEERKGFVAIALGIAIVMRMLAIVSAISVMAVIGLLGIAVVLLWILIPLIFSLLFFYALTKLIFPI